MNSSVQYIYKASAPAAVRRHNSKAPSTASPLRAVLGQLESADSSDDTNNAMILIAKATIAASDFPDALLWHTATAGATVLLAHVSLQQQIHQQMHAPFPRCLPSSSFLTVNYFPLLYNTTPIQNPISLWGVGVTHEGFLKYLHITANMNNVYCSTNITVNFFSLVCMQPQTTNQTSSTHWRMS